MDTFFFFFRWLNSQAGTSELGVNIVSNTAWVLDSMLLAAVALLMIFLFSWVPKEKVSTFLAAVLFTALMWLHLDAAYWRDTLPETGIKIVLTTIGVMVIPALSFIFTQWVWQARHS